MTNSYESPRPSALTKKSISHLAEKLARLVQYEPGGNIAAAVHALGGTVVYQDFWELDETDSGSIKVEPDGKFTIYVANHTAPTRDRFTIAHELGHFALHYLLPRTSNPEDAALKPLGLRATRFGSGQAEVEANLFAASFLMPEQQFCERFAGLAGDLVDVADAFGVSVSAASVRAKTLGLHLG